MHIQGTSPILTKHARECAQARGIRLQILEAIYANADCSPYVGEVAAPSWSAAGNSVT